MLLDGDIDLLAGLAYREERADLISCPEAIMGSEAYYLVKHDSATDVTPAPDTLNGKTIDVLDMSRIESGKVTIDEGDVHLPDIIHALRTIIQSNLSAKQLELFIDTQDVVHEDIITDKLRLNQILLNVLSNAIKFTPNGGTISFRVIEKPSPSPDKAVFEFRIKDNGIGMSEEFRKTIFEAFTREKTSTVSGIQGTGLGMAVPELQGLRALVADDDTNTCLSVCAMLREIGMRPDWTNYEKEAVIRAKDALDNGDEFNAYIIDWLMPDLNGIETVRRIRKVIGDSAPIIILTAYDWADIEEEAREAGMNGHLAKPYDIAEIMRTLKAILKKDVKEHGPGEDQTEGTE